MSRGSLMLGVGIGALVVAALLGVGAVVALVRWRNSGGWRQRLAWLGVPLAFLVMIGLIFGGIVALTHGAGTPESSPLSGYKPYTTIYHPAPTAADEVVTYTAGDEGSNARWVVGVSAQNGAVRWAKPMSGGVLLHPQPNLTIAEGSTADSAYNANVAETTIYAIRNTDGAILWKISSDRKTLDEFTPKYRADATRLYVLTDDPSSSTSAPEAYIAAFDLATGAQVWRHQLAPNSASTYHTLRAQFAVGDGLVFYAGEVGPGGNDASVQPFTVQAFDAATRVERWSASIGSAPDANGVMQANLVDSLAVSAGRLIVTIDPRGNWDTPPSLLALSERDGVKVWQNAFGVPQADSHVYIGEQLLWFSPIITTDANAIYLFDKFGVAGSGEQQHFIVKINASDGTSQMNTPLDSTQTFGDETLSVIGAMILQSANSLGLPIDGFAEGSSVIAYEAASGKQLWRQTGASSKLAWGVAAPQSGDQVLYLTALMDHSADPAPAKPQSPSLFGRPTGGTMGVVFLYAVNRDTGKPWWRVRTGAVTVRGSGLG